MKILVIFTGGTIGSALSDGWISPDHQTKKALIEHYRRNHGEDVEFTVREPYTVLSENLSAHELNLLITAVCEEIEGDYDGIIVTHGTDTLQYSAAALSYAIGSSCIPTLLVSSNYPLADERANGHANFEAAVEFIKNRCGRGVFAVYRNDDAVYFHRGLSLITHREADDDLFSLNGQVYAKLEDGHILVQNDTVQSLAPLGTYRLVDAPKILVIDSHPADSFNYDLDRYNAIILRPYHSGTLNTANAAFTDFCRRATEKGLPLYVVNVNKGAAYESAKLFSQLGLTALPDSTFAGVYMKLWIEISTK